MNKKGIIAVVILWIFIGIVTTLCFVFKDNIVEILFGAWLFIALGYLSYLVYGFAKI